MSIIWHTSMTKYNIPSSTTSSSLLSRITGQASTGRLEPNEISLVMQQYYQWQVCICLHIIIT